MEKIENFDFIFIGAGASTTLLLCSLEKRGLLSNHSIAIIDADQKIFNDKSYCFWASQDDPILFDHAKLIANEWSKVSINQEDSEILLNEKYVYISSISLYDKGREIVEKYGLTRISSKVSQVKKLEGGIEVMTDIGAFRAKQVFDSRPPIFSVPEKNEVILWQTFVGFVVTLERSLQSADHIDLMDFEVPQDGFTQFMYVLPFSQNQVLVELTRFGAVPITKGIAEPILTEYINLRYGKYQINHIEEGKIPMSTAKIQHEVIQGLIPIGGRSGAIKPSTGYAFKNMYEAAEQIASQLEIKGKVNSVQKRTNRFHFYDRLLLLILFYRPSNGQQIFSTLFKRNSIHSVFRFLEGKTRFLEDIKILFSLPIQPFLHVLRIEFKVRAKKLFFPLINLGLTLLLVATQFFASAYAGSIQFVIFAIGFVVVGLPHGAVDFLLDSRSKRKGISLGFIAEYLCFSFAFLAVWAVSSNSALLLFLIYSIWHFGQSDFRQWNPERSNPIKIVLWGVLLFGILLIGHSTETNEVLASLHTYQVDITRKESNLIIGLLLSISFIWSMMERNASFFLSIAMLSIGLFLPLFSAFSLYFIGQHSINGWQHLKEGLQTNNMELYLKSLPFNLGAIALLFLFNWLFSNYLQIKSASELMAIFFVFLSCISFPHVIWMHRFYQKKINV